MSYINKTYLKTQFDNFSGRISSVFAKKDDLSVYAKTADVVAKEDGKSLVSDTDIEQITKNKTAIETLNGDKTREGSVQKQISDALTNMFVDDVTEKKYKMGVENGLIYIQEVDE